MASFASHFKPSLGIFRRNVMSEYGRSSKINPTKMRSLSRSSHPLSARSYSTSAFPNPVIVREKSVEKLANVARVKPNGSTGRFFKKAVAVKTPLGYEVELDGYAIASKKGKRIVLPTEELAVAVAADWEGMHKRIDPRRMPIYTMASLATDMDDEIRRMHRETIMLVMEADALGHRTESPTPLLEKIWGELHDPLVKWFREEYNVPFLVHDQMSAKQSRKTVRTICKGIDALDDWSLLGLVTNVDTTLSVAASLALWNGKIGPEEAAVACRSESVVAETEWGDVPGNTDVRRAHYMMDLSSSTWFLRALATPPLNGERLKILSSVQDSNKEE